ncbi:biotin carboxyl carrier protein [Arcanobacterium wilhelmae]|uniref:Biotin carboxyl carrier protein n=1 Tax=Arcanobacterium wilhelmae TaxID=1803177 RepID=A0ABT9ND30_9ACTO|nr:hypothetical protein [Arcanobacterium wilhelmae]MDP9801626.1 biotin carboxyl carrier protein [Arcanobacterium wilhelmae]WFN90948.1 hypothetical protein P8A24_03605 [Arcanobacterium wilhelmae]
MKSKMSILLVGSMVASVGLVACGTHGTEQSQDPPESQSAPLVVVEKRDIAPTISQSGAIENLAPYVVLAPNAGSVDSLLDAGTTVKKGQRIAVIAGTEVVAPTDGRVTKTVRSGANVPAGFSIAVVESEAFSIPVESKLLKHQFSSGAQFSGRFQIEDGVGPSKCEAVVFREDSRGGSENEGGSGPGTAAAPGRASSTLQCVIPRNENVFPGSLATAVLVAKTRQQVLALPVEAVAGRQGHGEVIVHRDKTKERVAVSLGVNDGAWIELTSGVKEGEQVESLAPKLDPVGKQ